ncbi:methionine synthase [Petrotoga sp. 9PWA.NaAc.5.4]|uniref:methionine synthase n=1 Tax=Petrotoga sp. 9PWA.NaAc.5.4 TaxID=1434328 RepID=UPI000CBE8CC4|nr:methionine synthase [Petrotoga sp. 9PWA.NaAc.5.4]PNR93646.1 methionine synthase [Petrotoga sp. 9PWA.NaAc.5.4]
MSDLYLPETYEIMPQKRYYLFRAGFKGTQLSINERVKEEINMVYEIGLKLSKPKLIYDTFRIDQMEKDLIPKSFKGVKSITFFVSSLGEEIDKYISNSNLLTSMLMDAWGSEAIEALNDSFDKKLRARYGKGTLRFSPGYSDIDIRKNWDIINSLLKTDIVTVNKTTGIMLPRKSTVCMIGWYDE